MRKMKLPQGVGQIVMSVHNLHSLLKRRVVLDWD